MLIVSLSTIPPRFPHIGPTLHSLLTQAHRPDAIRLYIPQAYTRFPNWDGALPGLPEGIDVHRTRDDLGPATKVLPATRDLRGTGARILFCDDDAVYPPDWAAAMLAESRRIPDAAIAISGYEASAVAPSAMHRVHQPRARRRWRKTDLAFQARLLKHRIGEWRAGEGRPDPPRAPIKRAGYVDIFEGTAGVLVRPDWFDDTAFDIPALARGVDDVWLSGMLARQGIPIWLMANRREQTYHAADLTVPLRRTVLDGAGREDQNRATLGHLRQTYGIWP